MGVYPETTHQISVSTSTNNSLAVYQLLMHTNTNRSLSTQKKVITVHVRSFNFTSGSDSLSKLELSLLIPCLSSKEWFCSTESEVQHLVTILQVTRTKARLSRTVLLMSDEGTCYINPGNLLVFFCVTWWPITDASLEAVFIARARRLTRFKRSPFGNLPESKSPIWKPT